MVRKGEQLFLHAALKLLSLKYFVYGRTDRRSHGIFKLSIGMLQRVPNKAKHNIGNSK